MLRLIGIIILSVYSVMQVAGQVNQYGVPDIVNYPPEITEGSEQNWAVVQDQRGIIYVGNDDKGVLEFDGSEWKAIPIANNSNVYSLACADDGTVYVGAVSEIGYLAPDISGKLSYKSLIPMVDSAMRDFHVVWKTYCVGKKVYFHSQKMLLIYDSESNNIRTLDNVDHVLFGFHENGNYYEGSFSEGLFVLRNDTIFEQAKGGEFYSKKNIYGLASFDEQHFLIGVNYQDKPLSNLSRYNVETGEIDSTFAEEEVIRYLSNHFITNLRTLEDGTFLVSTYSGGVARISRDGKLIEVISKDQGLQNQIIYNSYQPTGNYPFSHVWTAMGLGVSKISFTSPLRKFTENSGFQGLIHCINSIDGKIFIGTSNGIFAIEWEDGFPRFQKVGSINQNIWDLKPFTLHTGENVLLAIGEGGFILVHKDGREINIKDRVSGNIREEDKVYWGYNILLDPFRPNTVYLGRESAIASMSYNNGLWKQKFTIEKIGDDIRTLGMLSPDTLWFSSKLKGVGYLTPVDSTGTIQFFDRSSGLPDEAENSLFNVGNELLIGTKDGIYRIERNNDSMFFVPDSLLNKELEPGKNEVLKIEGKRSKQLAISYENEFKDWQVSLLEAKEEGGYKVTSKPFYSMENFSTDAFHMVNDSGIWISKANVLYHFDKTAEFRPGKFSALVRKVTVDEGSVKFDGTHPRKDQSDSLKAGLKQDPGMIPTIDYSENNIEFRWSAPYFDHADETEYSYYLEGFSKGWSEWEKVLYQDFTNLPHGNYTFRIRARNVYDDISEIDEYRFVIDRPLYLRWYAFLFYVVVAVFIVYIIILLYTRRLKNENIRLEGIIQDRTTEIRKQKEELTDSIEYASRIQRALLPPEHMLENHGFDHFILFRPRDIVSGDFYWFGENNGKIFIVAADCTGHGVPGAFMSMLGISFLDEIVIKSGVSETNKILDALRNHVITSLRQTGKSMDESTKDGMDLAMVAIDEKTREIQYSGAYNPLYAIRKLSKEEKTKISKGIELDTERGTVYNEEHLLYQIRADHMPIGISEKDHSFTSSVINEQGATIYLFSDGYVDQFGGPMGKKFMSRNFKKLLLDIQHLSMEKQRERLNEELISWMGDINQIDDVLVIGIRI